MSEEDFAAEAAAAAVEAIEAGAAAAAPVPPAVPAAAGNKRKTPRRLCRFPGCTKVVKSQGACQRHGAKPKQCKMENCTKQAQGNFDGMCKRHFNRLNNPRPPPGPEEPPLQPTGQSVYDEIIPASVAWKMPKNKRGTGVGVGAVEHQQMEMPDPSCFSIASGTMMPPLNSAAAAAVVAAAPPPAEVPGDAMPIIAHLRKYAHLEAGWHRKQERAARGLPPPPGTSTQLDTWERQLVMFELLLLAGMPQANHKDLAHAWGREKGFHTVLCSQVCDRGGEIGRKRRNDAGRKLSEDQKKTFRKKVQGTRATKKAKTGAAVADEHALAAHETAAAAAAVAGGGDVTAVHGGQVLDGEGMMDMEHASPELADHQYHHHHGIEDMMMGQGEESHPEIDEAAQV